MVGVGVRQRVRVDRSAGGCLQQLLELERVAGVNEYVAN